MAESTNWLWTQEKRLPSERGASHSVLSELMAALQRELWSEREIFGIHLAVEEALVNAIFHGNNLSSEKQVHVVCKVSSERVVVEVADEGTGFDPDAVPDCTADENLDRPSGRGIMLMRSFMSRVEYEDGGCRVVMEKHRSTEEGN